MTEHWFVCAVCGERGGCDGQDEDGRGDDGEHVHFRQECWEVGPPSRHRDPSPQVPHNSGGVS